MFTGEASLLSGRRGLAQIRAAEAGELYAVDRETLLSLIQTDSDLSEVLMRAFILRRVELMAQHVGDVVVIGSMHCAGTLRVKEFLNRNAHPFTYVDLDEVGISTLKWVPGVNSLVQFGGEPAVVPDNFIYELKCRIEAIAAAGGLHLDGLKQGDALRITSGPFSGCEAIFDLMLDDRERAQVFIHWLGRRLKMQVNANAIAKQRAG